MSTGVKYLHNEVYLVCSNGMKKDQLDVADRGVRVAGDKLLATKDDKPDNFMCKWAGIIMALLAGFCLIFLPFAIGPILGLLISFIAGLGGALTLGSGLCYLATRSSHWENYHRTVKAMGVNALTEKSTLKCFLGGQIYTFFSPVIAEKQAWAFAAANAGQILTAASVGSAGGAVFQIGKTYGIMSSQMGMAMAWTGAGIALNEGLARASGFLADQSSDGILTLTGLENGGNPSPMHQTIEGDPTRRYDSWPTVGETVKTYKNMVLDLPGKTDKLVDERWRNSFDRQGYMSQTRGLPFEERMRIGKDLISGARNQVYPQAYADARHTQRIRSIKSAASPFVGGLLFDTTFQTLQKNVDATYLAEETDASADVKVFAADT